MSINCSAPDLPTKQATTGNWLKTLAKYFNALKSSPAQRPQLPDASLLDNHLRRDIGLPDAEPRPDPYLVEWKDPLSAEFRRR